jgi:Holliday junction resolvasome RuvABC ATP-dependent DNA helicase subunit
VRFIGQTRAEFIDHLKQFVHPSEEISNPTQLVGRRSELNKLRDCFETNGAHAFAWGLRGVGKTSLVHTACEEFSDLVRLGAAIGCEKQSSKADLMTDLYRRIAREGKVDLSTSSIKGKLDLFGVITAEQGGKTYVTRIEPDTINHASDFLGTILETDHVKGRDWVIIIDEFDQLENRETIDFFTALAKQLSVDKIPLKFVFCGVGSNLNDLIGSHESVDRYINTVQVDPLLIGDILKIVENISQEFEVNLSRGQKNRIGQIACGYPHFAHVIMNEILKECYDRGVYHKELEASIYKSGVQRAAKSAATRLQRSYELASRRGTDRYIEVLWALADGQLMVKQFKSIRDDYFRIMEDRKDREPLTKDQDLRNHLNNLCKGDDAVLRRGKVGWYEFVDPMFRSYVRLKAHENGVELGDESFKD